ncbi:MAG: ATP-binding protein, partial [Bacteroidota bacterium]
NHLKLRKVAQRFIIVSLLVCMCGVSLLYGPQLGALLGLLMSGLLIFIFCPTLNERLAYWAAILLVFFIAEITVHAYGAPYSKELSYISYVLLFISNFGGILLIGFYFKQEQKLAQDIRNMLLEDLSEQDAILQAQNAKLTSQLHEIRWIHQELERFSYATSHHFRTPLRSINNFVNLIERELEDIDDSKVQLYLKFVKQSSQTAYRLVEDTLSYIRIARDETLCEWVDLNQIFEDARQDCLPLIHSTHALIVSRPLPKVWGMKAHMRLLFIHLIKNAIQHNHQKVPKLIISATKNRQYMQLKFLDNGVGINPDFHQQIFQVFTRLSTSEDGSQTGIGLAICHKIVHLAQGSIHIQSQNDHGSTFVIHLPATNKRKRHQFQDEIASISNGSSYLN